MGCVASTPTNVDWNVDVNVTSALSSEVGGTIEVKSNHTCDCEWRKNGNAALLQLSANRMKATNVPTGDYEILCKSGAGEKLVHARVERLPILCVDSYVVQHASNDLARDGQIEAVVKHAENADIAFLWTTGIVTETPTLYDVRPGTYSVTIVSQNKLAMPFYHACNPAIVGIQEGARL